MIRNMVMVFILFLMAAHIKGSGQMISNTVKVLLQLKVNQKKICGKMERELDG